MLFSHLITSSMLTWPELRQRAELQLNTDLSAFTPVFVDWNDVLLKPDRLLNGRYFTKEIESVVIIGRGSNRILVTKVDSKESFYGDQYYIHSTNDIVVKNVETLKNALIHNSTFID